MPSQLAGVDRTTYASIRASAPPLIHRYADEGVWDWDHLVLDLAKNPYYVRGDFDGDGTVDVAVYVLTLPSVVSALAVLHGDLDRIRLFADETENAAFFPDNPGFLRIDERFIGEHLRVLAAGTRVVPVPCSALRPSPDCDDRIFTLGHDAFEVHYHGKSSAVYVWRDDRYALIPTSD